MSRGGESDELRWAFILLPRAFGGGVGGGGGGVRGMGGGRRKTLIFFNCQG